MTIGIHRLKKKFTSGELSPLLGAQLDFDRYRSGCKKLLNMVSKVQGPATRRPGLKYIYDLTSVGADAGTPVVRQAPFIYSETQAYSLIFFKHTDGTERMVVGVDDGLVVDGGGNVFVLTLPTGFDISFFDYAQSLDELYIAQSNMRPLVIIRNDHDDWTWAYLTFTCFPGGWPHDPLASIDPVDADYDATSNWPASVTFHQQRLVWGGNDTHRQHVWESASGSYLNFGKLDGSGCGGTDPADGLSFRLDSGTEDRIRWIVSGKVLAIGTLGNEWTVRGNGQTSITPQSVLAQRQTYSGSEKIKPLTIGQSIIFVGLHGRVVNEFKYEYTVDSYDVSDRSVLATHLTEKHSITKWSFQQTPDKVIWCVLSGGSFIGCTFQREHKVVGWHQHSTDGEVLSCSVHPGNNRDDEVWFTIKRVVNSANKVYVERLGDEFYGDKASESRYADSWVYKPVVNGVVTGLGHLEGKEVCILANGTVHPKLTVTGGQVTLDSVTLYNNAVIGLPFRSEVRPFLGEVPMKDGTSFGRVQRIVDIDIDFYKTSACQIGTINNETGVERVEELPFRIEGDLMGTETPLYTGIYHYPFFEGFSRNSDYFIRQEDPLPLTVRGVVDIVEVS